MSDPVFGKKWQLSPKQSTSTTGPTTAVETRVYKKVGRGYELTVAGTHEGQPYEWGYTVGYDGKPSRVHGRDDVDAIRKHKVTDLITIGSFTKKGRVVASYRRDTSPDGKVLTVVASGNRPDGTTYFDVLKYKPAKA